jgi:UDP-N-acetylglucosamine 2-epimerase (non-hydrolysing)
MREGVAAEKIYLVGNVMIDTLIQFLPKANEVFPQLQEKLQLGSYGLVTLHRPSNVDEGETFLPMLAALRKLSNELPLIFPVHPRTKQKWSEQLNECSPGIRAIEPQGYLEFLALQKNARLVITDSGGIQEDTTYLGTPCLTLRENTERPITITSGTNVLIGRDWDLLDRSFRSALQRNGHPPTPPPLWDGKASERIADILSK